MIWMCDPFISVRRPLPLLHVVLLASASLGKGPETSLQVEASGVEDSVKLVLSTVHSLDTSAGHLLYSLRDELHIGFIKSLEIIIWK